MKLVYKLAVIGAALASGITAASAQNSMRHVDRQDWRSSLTAGPSYGGNEIGGTSYHYGAASRIDLPFTPAVGDERELNNH